MSDSKHGRDAADAVIDELYSRRGFDYWWDDVDGEIREEIKDTLAERIEEEYSDE